MENEFTEVTETGLGANLMGSLRGVLVGFILIIVALGVLWWNEGRAVKQTKNINFAKDHVVIATADKLDSANENKLIYVNGKAQTKDILTDSVFGVSVNGFKFYRDVEMYQWEENEESKQEKKLGGGTKTITTYKYKKVWSPSLNDSSLFKHNSDGKYNNPVQMLYKSENFIAEDAKLGAYKLSSVLIRQIDKTTTFKELPKTKVNNAISMPKGYYIGKDISNPQIGDYKVTFKFVANNQEVSVIAGQTADTLNTFTTPYGSFGMVESGTVAMNQMFAKAHKSNSLLTWVLRIIGFIATLIGVNMLFGPIVAVANILPIFGDLVEGFNGIVAFCISTFLCFTVIALAWIFYRPMIGIPLLVIAILSFIFVIKKRKKA